MAGAAPRRLIVEAAVLLRLMAPHLAAASADPEPPDDELEPAEPVEPVPEPAPGLIDTTN